MPFWSGKPTTHTNAPRHWPAIELGQFDNAGVNLIIVGGQLAALAKRPGTSMALMRDFVYEDGILRVPIVVEEGGQKTCVFVYSNRDKNAAAHYSGVRALLRTRENALAVYYGPEALAPATAGAVLQPIDTPSSRRRLRRATPRSRSGGRPRSPRVWPGPKRCSRSTDGSSRWTGTATCS